MKQPGVRLAASLAEKSPHGYVQVNVSVVSDGETLGARELLYKLMYPARQAVLTADVAKGEALTESNVAIRTVLVDRPQRRFTNPIGKLARQDLRKGAVLRDGLLAARSKRNQSVLMVLEGEGFKLSALGLALQDGRAGDYIKVRNADSKRIITCKINFDGSVEPIFDQEK
jgi:flagella basal body P-ring formation protein FlgA